MKTFNALTELKNDITGCASSSKHVNCTLDEMSRHNQKLTSLTSAFLQCTSVGNTVRLLSHCLTPQQQPSLRSIKSLISDVNVHAPADEHKHQPLKALQFIAL